MGRAGRRHSHQRLHVLHQHRRRHRADVLRGSDTFTVTGDGSVSLVNTFDGSAPQDGPSFSIGNLWDKDVHDVSSILPAGQTTLSVRHSSGSDCVASRPPCSRSRRGRRRQESQSAIWKPNQCDPGCGQDQQLAHWSVGHEHEPVPIAEVGDVHDVTDLVGPVVVLVGLDLDAAAGAGVVDRHDGAPQGAPRVLQRLRLLDIDHDAGLPGRSAGHPLALDAMDAQRHVASPTRTGIRRRRLWRSRRRTGHPGGAPVPGRCRQASCDMNMFRSK